MIHVQFDSASQFVLSSKIGTNRQTSDLFIHVPYKRKNLILYTFILIC